MRGVLPTAAQGTRVVLCWRNGLHWQAWDKKAELSNLPRLMEETAARVGTATAFLFTGWCSAKVNEERKAVSRYNDWNVAKNHLAFDCRASVGCRQLGRADARRC